ncbi:eukaryotic translation initiation factor 3 subunit H, partial [Tanacetum coccineum]
MATAAAATRSFLQVAATEEAVAPPLRVVQIEGLVILKIIKHCAEFSPALVTGQLLGLDVGSVLEVTNCFPFPIREEDEEIEAEGANYQLEMMRCLREVNVDNNTVGCTPSPVWSENETLEVTKQRMKWENEDYICRGHILNGMSDSLFDIYQNAESAKTLWESLESKYMAEDASATKFLVSSFMNYKMVDTRPVME